MANLFILYKCLLFLLCRAAAGPLFDLGDRCQQLPDADNAIAILRCKPANSPALPRPHCQSPAPHRTTIEGPCARIRCNSLIASVLCQPRWFSAVFGGIAVRLGHDT